MTAISAAPIDSRGENSPTPAFAPLGAARAPGHPDRPDSVLAARADGLGTPHVERGGGRPTRGPPRGPRRAPGEDL